MGMLSLGDHLREEFVLWDLPGPVEPAILKALIGEAEALFQMLLEEDARHVY